MVVTPSEFRKGLKVEIDGQPYEVISYQFTKPGKGTPFTATRFKHLMSGNVLDINVRSGERMTVANTEQQEMAFLYAEGDLYTFMNNETFDQTQMTPEQIGDATKYLIENTTVKVLFYNDRPIGVELPNFLTLPISYCEPGIKGDTATGATKPATLTTGAIVMVPLFVEQGDVIRVDTRSDSYIERVKK